jgi:cell volume regulation protein A
VSEGEQILVAGLLLAAGLGASLLAVRLRLPSLVLFLGVGMLVGSDGLGFLAFDNYHVAREVGIVALALILFEGGLAAGWREVRPVLGPALSLALVGTAVTAVIAGVAATWLFDLHWKEGLLLGSIVASTDGAAIFALLRDSPLRRRLARTLEAEAGFNDPVAVLLVLGFINVITKDSYGALDMLGLFAQQLGIGAAVGLGVGWLAPRLARRARLESPGLYPVASLATAAIAFGAADALHGSGFLAVYLVGLALGDATIPARRAVVNFHEGLAWVAQLSMFLVLGLLVFPSDLGDVALEGTVLALVIVLVARPIATFVATPYMRFAPGQRFVLGWAGLRGAVPVVLATFPVIAGVPGSKQFFDIVFFAVVVSTLLQGTTIEPLARRLGAISSRPDPPPRRLRPQVHGFAPVFTVRPWKPGADGDPADPAHVDGKRVVSVERVRLDRRGALVVLEDGTFAITGPLLARGGRRMLSDWVRRRISAGVTETERRWWEDVLGALAL